ncbi:MAG: hypothetical protein LBG22_01130 [Treponema sp.]|jgi:hypothetical protein|nr:hypothetical protein [Treponema sp.]
MRIHKSDIKDFPRFGLTDKNLFTDKTCFFAVGEHLFFLLAYLNSSIGRYLCKRYVSILDNGGYLMQKAYLEPIPITKPSSNKIEEIEKICKMILRDSHKSIEIKLNRKIYELFNFTPEETYFIENDNLEELSR